VTAALQGRVQVRGDVALAQKFHGLVGTLALNRSYSFASSGPTVDLNRGVHPPVCKVQNC
jgi:ubiquinone biosynthesis protein UbiJ